MKWRFLVGNRTDYFTEVPWIPVCSFLSSSLDLHSVITQYLFHLHKVHSVGCWFYVRCRRIRQIWPILGWLIIISVFIDVLHCCKGFILFLFTHNFVFLFNRILCVEIIYLFKSINYNRIVFQFVNIR